MNKFLSVFVMGAIISVKGFAGNLPDEILQIPIPVISGEKTSLAVFKEKKPVFMKFWASW